ncbi:reverse transcriptase (RNA-dependent DNA polymerase) domain-containing protein [Phthorimaea operculella]|nr:reverse transcriptase (RNA-dependent DNA polymerase) domain-containing protein [Phthorimaea operculella]
MVTLPYSPRGRLSNIYFTVILPDIVPSICIRGIAYKWFESYLHQRKQFVELDYHENKSGIISKIRSKVAYLNHSIPQGSVLGCLLFLIYINDLPKLRFTNNIKTTLYADDISLIFPCSNTIPKIELSIKYSYNNTQIQSVNSCRLLGIEIDTHNIAWKEHVEMIAGKLSRFSYALYELKKSTDLHTATCAYYAYAHAWLQYAIILWADLGTVFCGLLLVLVNGPMNSCCLGILRKSLVTRSYEQAPEGLCYEVLCPKWHRYLNL